MMRIKFDIVEPKKHSIRFDTTDKDSPIQTIYIKKEFFMKKTPKSVEVEVEAFYE